MRITNSMMLNNMMRNMSKNLSRMSKTEESLATGKKFLRPSDDPIGVSRSLRLNTEVANMEQFKRNAEDALSWLDTTEMALKNITDVLHRARELTVKAVSETNSIDERKAIAAEISELKNQLINIANTTYAGSSIFTGFKTNKVLLDGSGNYYLKQESSDPVQILKASEEIEYSMGISDRITVNLTAQKVFGADVGIDAPLDKNSDIDTTPPAKTPQMIKVFNQLIFDLNANDSANISKALTRIDLHFNNINAVTAEVGVKSNRIELTLNRIDDDTLNLKDLLSKNEDADVAEVIMNLKMQENVYKASLSGGARIIQPTLMDFLR